MSEDAQRRRSAIMIQAQQQQLTSLLLGSQGEVAATVPHSVPQPVLVTPAGGAAGDDAVVISETPLRKRVSSGWVDRGNVQVHLFNADR
eukprot:289845-Rhodomonas_salina.1